MLWRMWRRQWHLRHPSPRPLPDVLSRKEEARQALANEVRRGKEVDRRDAVVDVTAKQVSRYPADAFADAVRNALKP
jgi:hypothetical protein